MQYGRLFLQEMHNSSFCGSWKPQKGQGVVSSSSSDVSGRLWAEESDGWEQGVKERTSWAKVRMKYRLCEVGWRSGKSRRGRQRKQEVWTHRTIASIFFLYFGSISFRYSGLISMAAKLNDEFFSPARWHSMTADVRMGTTSTHTWTPFRFLLDSF